MELDIIRTAALAYQTSLPQFAVIIRDNFPMLQRDFKKLGAHPKNLHVDIDTPIGRLYEYLSCNYSGHMLKSKKNLSKVNSNSITFDSHSREFIQNFLQI
jgi:hypothetical protein